MDIGYTIGQRFTLKKDTVIIIDDNDAGTSKACEINNGTNFEIKSIDNVGYYSVNFEGVGLAMFTDEELDEITKWYLISEVNLSSQSKQFDENAQ